MFEWHHVLDFWFGPLDDDDLPDRAHQQRWFASSRAFDREVRRRFFSMMLVASEDGLDTWRKAPGGRLAEILLLDQIPRHVHRGTALAFDYDRMARRLCQEGLAASADIELPLVGRAFFYMPLQHSEHQGDQEHAVELYEQLTALAPAGPVKDLIAGFLKSAREHREIVSRFGRFPHRNKSLKRSSTLEEEEYLAAGATGFGQ